MKQEIHEREHKKRRGVLQGDGISRRCNLISRNKGANGRRITRHRDEEWGPRHSRALANEEREDQRGEKAAVENNRQRRYRKKLNENAGETPENGGEQEKKPRPVKRFI